jgi:hypothetical protein
VLRGPERQRTTWLLPARSSKVGHPGGGQRVPAGGGPADARDTEVRHAVVLHSHGHRRVGPANVAQAAGLPGPLVCLGEDGEQDGGQASSHPPMRAAVGMLPAARTPRCGTERRLRHAGRGSDSIGPRAWQVPTATRPRPCLRPLEAVAHRDTAPRAHWTDRTGHARERWASIPLVLATAAYGVHSPLVRGGGQRS